VLGQIGLSAHAHEFVRTFSGGMKRRLNFGAALLHEPRLVILDEPTVGVDPQSRQHVLDCVRQLAAKGVAVIYASHYMEEVEALCQRVAIIDHGRIIASGTLDELLDKSHADLYLRVTAPESALKHKLAGLADVTPLNGNESEAVIHRERKSSAKSTTVRLAQVLDVLAAAGFDVLSVETREHNLERLFLQLTGRKLRD
jgi:ABC-2 type transport system ATP-binding protein